MTRLLLNPRAFEIALQRLEEPPGNPVFGDDQPTNLAGAETVGMRVQWFIVTNVASSITQTPTAL